MIDDRTPVLVGAGQIVQRDAQPAEALEPIALMEAAARAAARDAGVAESALSGLDRVAVVNVIGWHYGNAPRLLAARLGAAPHEEIYTSIGGNTPQALVNRTARDIADGRVDLALVAGAEAIATLRRAGKAGLRVRWTAPVEGTPRPFGDTRDGTSAHENAHGLALPAQVYPMFENALRARAGRSVAEHQERLGSLCSRLSEVAAGHPQAWFPERRTPAEIATASPANRYVGFPYTKRMNAILEVDQGAALLLTSVGRARALGIDPSRFVYLRGSADAHDHWFVSERVDFATSPAIRAAGRRALARAGIGIDGVDLFDLYSCFPCAVEIGRDMLGIAEDDPRPLTVTGGLACFGGPGNNYSTHAIATMMDRLRERPGTIGLVTALGWYVTKHSVGVYGTEPGGDPRGGGSDEAGDVALQAEVDRDPRPEFTAAPRGPATIETFTVAHDRDGAPVRGIVFGRLDDGRRFLANTPEDRAVLEALETGPGVGARGSATPGDGDATNLFAPS